MMQTPPASRTGNESCSDSDFLDVNYDSDLKTHEYETAVIDEITRIGDSENRRISTEEQLFEIEQYMLRVFDRLTALLSIAIQTWDRDRSIITEVGISIYDPRHQKLALVPNIKSYHFIISEHQRCKNGDATPDHSSNFAGGISHVMSKLHTCQVIDGIMGHYFGPEFPLNCFLVGHSVKSNLKWLETIGVFIDHEVPTLDTQVLFSLTHGHGNICLKNALTTVNQPFSFLFNAGNWAYYTTILALKLCDPMVRRLTGMDYLKKNEERDKPVRYKKRDINKSGQQPARAKDLLDDIMRVGVCKEGE